MSTRVVVVVLNWNSYGVTADCLRSLRRSSHADLTVLLVDNGSVDGSPEQLETEFPEAIVLRNSRNLGFTGGMNAGMRHAPISDADYVLLLNNDTIVDPEAISEMVRALEADPHAALACPKIYFWDVPEILWFAGGRLSCWNGIGVNIGRRVRDRGQYDVPGEISFANGCAVLLRRSALETLGLFDPDLFAYAEDVDYSFRALRSGQRMLYVPQARIWHREGFASKRNIGNPKRIYYGTRNLLLVMCKHVRWYHWLTLAPNFMVNWVCRFVFLSVIRRERPGAVVCEMIRGVRDFLRMSSGRAPQFGEPRTLAAHETAVAQP